MADAPHILIVEARYYDDISDALLAGAQQALAEAGATTEVITVPGALEIPAVVRFAIRAMDLVGGRRRYDGYVALGCVIRGETSHYDIVAGESARGLQELALNFSIAIGNGIITVENSDQAWARAAVDRGNKGGFAANATLAMLDVKRRLGLFPR
ncbi:6,7-dimethyl-8-ribityllumazine synthase [Oceanibacterium hippocampi]|uniref:6,7-dimethyl-8-ribityllumazine synthase n=1 Tax=Oceanibacterium hippocampi TaxID=745714 RepID=A0A1Y5SP10_9PROT|nr:6,7-dimethyl-8-ribityllumazine synthase [Oceanibacterium hippocampi]SLN44924.1 6,7-dimethyl-8-ribityllumazine synthase 1 [Oceanibacterium hippocampi]